MVTLENLGKGSVKGTILLKQKQLFHIFERDVPSVTGFILSAPSRGYMGVFFLYELKVLKTKGVAYCINLQDWNLT